ncbi:hypothetical protein [Nonomuraea roseoviolacea]|uniref:Uncharacterized protein n=1 Tax=Nonomuraea roseoviolacea subsp. carminata TaxID=160689 RepID=A0ABT1K123_9ACTN|nr:hypothetical protein [Nonomuraea roseoviolacea]MCP2347302.1 hypothetical protein [Nonomuraea roseoviolacea subsp. carminata]
MGQLTWFPLPFGLVVVFVDFFAVRDVNGRLPGAPAEAWNEHAVLQSIDAFIPFAQGRIALLGGLFIAAALLFGLVEFGLGRRPAGLVLGTGFLSAVYVAAMPVVYVLNPVTGYDVEFPEPSGAYSTVPFDMDALSPPWYLPLLGCVLAAAAIAQLITVRGVVRRGAALPPSPRRAWLLLLPSAFLPAFALANFVSDRIARATAPPGSFWEADSALELMVQVCAFAVVPAAGLVLLGFLLRRRGLRPCSLLFVGVLTVVYLLMLFLVAWTNLRMYVDEQSGFSWSVPGWREEVTTGILCAAALAQLAALALLARRGRDVQPVVNMDERSA